MFQEGGLELDALTWVSPLLSGSQERQDKLRDMGFVDILHKLSQASDTNLSDRWATAAHIKARRLVKQDTLCMLVCVFGWQGKDSNAAVPGVTLVEERGHQKDFCRARFYCTKAQFVDLWWVTLHLPHLQLRQAPVAWLFLLDAIIWVILFSSFFFSSSKWAAGTRRCSWTWRQTLD